MKLKIKTDEEFKKIKKGSDTGDDKLLVRSVFKLHSKTRTSVKKNRAAATRGPTFRMDGGEKKQIIAV